MPPVKKKNSQIRHKFIHALCIKTVVETQRI